MNGTDDVAEDLVTADAGEGPLLERDYWAVLEGSRIGADEFGELLAEQLCALAPPELVVFEREQEARLDVGIDLGVLIRRAARCGVRVVHRDANSLTLATLRGHPEAGRITFGAYPDERGDVVFHIRSRARSSSRAHYIGFLVGGDAMQTSTWTEFINRIAAVVADGVRGAIHVEKREVDQEPGDIDPCSPTFRARGA